LCFGEFLLKLSRMWTVLLFHRSRLLKWPWCKLSNRNSHFPFQVFLLLFTQQRSKNKKTVLRSNFNFPTSILTKVQETDVLGPAKQNRVMKDVVLACVRTRQIILKHFFFLFWEKWKKQMFWAKQNSDEGSACLTDK